MSIGQLLLVGINKCAYKYLKNFLNAYIFNILLNVPYLDNVRFTHYYTL